MLNNFKKNIYSQNGEDGIIEEILKRLGNHSDKSCVEFGSWDGMFNSNIFNLLKNHSFKGVCIESDSSKFEDLEKNMKNYQTICINKYVDDIGPNSLDNILLDCKFNENFDLLSIDINGMDYYIIENLQKFKPKIICVEYNPTIPPDIEFVQKRDFKVVHGSSSLAFYKMAKKKNYHLIASTTCNLIFIHDSYKKIVVGDTNLSFENLVNFEEKFNVKVFVGFDGTLFTNQKIKLPWHRTEINIKQIPKFLRFFPTPGTSIIRKIMLRIYKTYQNPSRYMNKLKKVFKFLFNQNY